MRANRSRDTQPELRVRSLVHKDGLRYRVNTRPLTKLRRTADMVFGPARVAVFLDGCFWHKCPQHFVSPQSNTDYWREKIARNVVRDAETVRLLEDEGWVALRFWEHEDPRAAADEIIQVVAARRSSIGKTP